MSKENDEEKYAIDKQKLRQAFNGIYFIYIIFFTVQLNRGVIPGCVLKPNTQDWGLSGGVGCSKDSKFGVGCWYRMFKSLILMLNPTPNFKSFKHPTLNELILTIFYLF